LKITVVIFSGHGDFLLLMVETAQQFSVTIETPINNLFL